MNSKINKVIFAEMKEFFNKYSEEPDEMYEKMLDHFKNLTTEKKSKIVKQKTVYESNQRCIGLKANEERCSNKKFVNGDNPDLCSIHNKKPPKKFFTEAEPDDDTEIDENEEVEKETCCYKFSSKSKKNELCKKKCVKGKKLCSIHLKNVEYIKNAGINKEEEKNEEEQNDEKEDLFGDESTDEDY